MQKNLTDLAETESGHVKEAAPVSWREDVVTGIILFLFYFMGGAYIDLYRGYLPGDAISRLVSAWLVTQGTVAKVSSIGFVWPPIPTLLLIPWASIPGLFQNWMAVVVVSAMSMSIACVMVGHIASICRITKWWRRAIVFLFAANPLVVMFGINGMSEAILMATTLIAMYWLIQFWQTGRNTHLIFAAAFFGLLPMIRYEFVLITGWSGVLILVLIWEKRHQFTREKFGQFLEGILLAYTSLAIYPTFLWIVASWFIMGNPLYFLLDSRSATNLAVIQISDFGIITTPMNSFRITFGIWLWAFPLELIATAALILLGWRKKSNFLIGLGLMPLLVPALQFLLLVRRSGVPLLRYFVMVVPLGLLVTMVFLFVFSGVINRYRWGQTSVMAVFILLLFGSNIMSAVQLDQYPYQSIEAPTWQAMTGKNIQPNPRVSEAYAIGELLVKTIPAGSKVLMDTNVTGFAILLGANTHSIFMDFSDPNYDAALLNPVGYVDYILVPEPIQQNEFYSVNMVQKSLYANGARWAELVNVLPETIDRWKLYKVLK